MKVPLYDREIDLGPKPSGLCVKRWSGAGRYAPEAETVAWIESLPSGSVFFDVGASVGTHAVRASLRGLEVHAFEPQQRWASELSAIITRNNLSVRVCEVALSDYPGTGMLVPGRSTHTFTPERRKHQKGGITATTIDEYAKAVAAPDYIKLDVDGNELDVLMGAVETLPNVRGLLVEVDPQAGENAHIPAFLVGYGFKYDYEQYERDRIPSGKYAGTANVIFWRE